jgi:hypothetical protein
MVEVGATNDAGMTKVILGISVFETSLVGVARYEVEDVAVAGRL